MENEKYIKLEKLIFKAKEIAEHQKKEKQEYDEIICRLKENLNILYKTNPNEASALLETLETCDEFVKDDESKSNFLQNTRRSIKVFEATHPKLMRTIEEFIDFLANLGV